MERFKEIQPRECFPGAEHAPYTQTNRNINRGIYCDNHNLPSAENICEVNNFKYIENKKPRVYTLGFKTDTKALWWSSLYQSPQFPTRGLMQMSENICGVTFETDRMKSKQPRFAAWVVKYKPLKRLEKYDSVSHRNNSQVRLFLQSISCGTLIKKKVCHV